MKRNQVKLHDNMLRLLQEREDEKAERRMLIERMVELRDEVRLIVRKKRII